MKRIYWLAAMTAVITLGSCSNDQELDNPQTANNKEIGFRSFIDKGANSRATVTNSDNILGFTVTGWWDKNKTGNISGATEDEYPFNAFDISRREIGIDNWSYSPLRYWPAPEIIGNGITFFAYSPASSKNVGEETSPGSRVFKGGLHNFKGDKIRYTVPNPQTQAEIRVEPQEDFLLARTAPMTEGKVELSFAHTLSRVKFFARTTKPNLTYVIGGIEMLGLAMTGDIDINKIPTNGTFAYNDTKGSTPITHWVPDAASKGKLVLDMGSAPTNLLADYQSLHGESGALMVLPQETELGEPTVPKATLPSNDPNHPDNYSKFLIRVRYKAYLNNPGGTYYAGGPGPDEYEDVYFMVADQVRSEGATVTPHTFEIGRQYNFYLTFGSEVGGDITFAVNVGDWSDTPPVFVPQVNYYGAGLISEKLAVIANPAYNSNGVSMNDMEGVTGTITLNITSAADLKGLEYFKNLTGLNIETTVDNLEIVMPQIPLQEMLLRFTGSKNPTIKKLDISKLGATLTRVNYVTGSSKVGYSDDYGTMTISEAYMWAGFDKANTPTLFKTGYNDNNRPSLAITQLYIDGIPNGTASGS